MFIGSLLSCTIVIKCLVEQHFIFLIWSALVYKYGTRPVFFHSKRSVRKVGHKECGWPKITQSLLMANTGYGLLAYSPLILTQYFSTLATLRGMNFNSQHSPFSILKQPSLTNIDLTSIAHWFFYKQRTEKFDPICYSKMSSLWSW